MESKPKTDNVMVITREKFVELANLIKEEYLAAQKLDDAIVEYAGERDFNGFTPTRLDKLVKWLGEVSEPNLPKDVVEDYGYLISCWAYENEFGDMPEKDLLGCRVEGGEEIRLKTPDDIWRAIMGDKKVVYYEN